MEQILETTSAKYPDVFPWQYIP